MNVNSVLIATALSLLAVTQPVIAAEAQRGYCGPGTGLLRMNSTEETILQVYEKCGPGDIVAIPGNSTAVIARICDFTKTIYLEPDGLAVCVMGSLKPFRTKK